MNQDPSDTQPVATQADGTVLLRDFVAHLTALAAEPGMENARVAVAQPAQWLQVTQTQVVGVTEGLTGETTMVVGLVVADHNAQQLLHSYFDAQLHLDMATMERQAVQTYERATGDRTNYALDVLPEQMVPYLPADYARYDAEITRRVAAGQPYWCNAETVARLSDAQLVTAMAQLEAERLREDDPNALDAVADHWRDYRREQLARQVSATSAQTVAELDNVQLLALFEAHRDLALLDYDRVSEVRHHTLDWSNFLPDTHVHLDVEIAHRGLAWSWFETNQDNPLQATVVHELPF